MNNPVLTFLFCLTCYVSIPLILPGQHRMMIHQNNSVTGVELISGDNCISRIPHSGYPDNPVGYNAENKILKEGQSGYNWHLKFSAPGKVFKDVSFAGSQTGYIVTELGSVFKSVNSGENWTAVMNLGFPYYWYGVEALSPDTVVIAGFNNQAAINQGTIRWSFNGGVTWTADINLVLPFTAVGWLDRIHFFNQDTGIVMNSFSGGCWYTANGGKEADSWNYVNINPDYSWFAGNIDAQPSGKVFATGLHFARSSDYGMSWISGPCADIVFDGGVDVLDEDNSLAWTGGGQISTPVEGWVCRTTDGGFSWSARLKNFEYPIRAVSFTDALRGWAVGGNVYNESGGIWSTPDGGLTWNLDLSTLAEMFSMEIVPSSTDSSDVWCVGSTGGSTGFTGKLYKTRIGNTTTGTRGQIASDSPQDVLLQNFPNPFSVETTIGFYNPHKQLTSLTISDLYGKVVKSETRVFDAGYHEINFQRNGLLSGACICRVSSSEFTKSIMLMVSE